MKLILAVICALTVAVGVRSQQQPPKAQEPLPHSEQHSPGNPPPAQSAPLPANVNLNANSNASIPQGGNTLTNVAVPKPENTPKAEPPPAGGPKAEPPADHDHDHDHDHEHSPGNPKHLDHPAGGVQDVRANRFIFIIAAVMPLALSFLTISL